jgi:hypothetical protein
MWTGTSPRERLSSLPSVVVSEQTNRHEYRVTESVEHTIFADRPLTGPELKRAIDRARGDADVEPGVEIRWETARSWVGPAAATGTPGPAVEAPIVDAVDDTYD